MTVEREREREREGSRRRRGRGGGGGGEGERCSLLFRETTVRTVSICTYVFVSETII